MKFFLVFSLALLSIVFASDNLDSHLLMYGDDVGLLCNSWRVAGEANNLSPWKKVPEECRGYVKDYMTSRAYVLDLQMVANEAVGYARGIELGDDGNDVWVFDVDETLLSNLPYYAHHGYGYQVFNHGLFDKWVENGTAPVIESSLKLYEEVFRLGFKVFLLTGRSERHRNITVENLRNAGFMNWDKLILRDVEDYDKSATTYKSEKRSEMVKEGYRVLGNSGDQWSDLLGAAISIRSFKLPNPMYYIA
ncbi:hypothetical protein GIB67_015579 [Kingdonia uniflora]|uniref:Acid phosphatase n=1 Tax=Kingdonia uniflora TaxID=39325 RepID=A0A7J7LTZ3_9MAGN|nr:hypothetical protein GIB67_015579 [Kingdonia uniflora]